MPEKVKTPVVSSPPLGPGDGGRDRLTSEGQAPLSPGASERAHAKAAPVSRTPLQPGDHAGIADATTLVGMRPLGPGDVNVPMPTIRRRTGV